MNTAHLGNHPIVWLSMTWPLLCLVVHNGCWGVEGNTTLLWSSHHSPCEKSCSSLLSYLTGRSNEVDSLFCHSHQKLPSYSISTQLWMSYEISRTIYFSYNRRNWLHLMSTIISFHCWYIIKLVLHLLNSLYCALYLGCFLHPIRNEAVQTCKEMSGY